MSGVAAQALDGTRRSAHDARFWALVSATGSTAFLLASAALGRLGLALDDPRDFRLAVVHWLLAGYLPWATASVSRGVRRARAEIAWLAPGVPPGSFDAVFRALPGDRGRRAACAVAGVLATLAAVVWSDPAPGLPTLEPGIWSPEVWWQRALEPWIGVWSGLFVAELIAGSDRVSRAAALLGPVDLLDRSPFQAFTRFGLRNALLATGLLSLLALFVIESGLAAVVVALVTLTGVIAAIGLLLPMRGVRARIREAKRSELAAVEAEIRRTRARPGEGAPVAPPGRLADLLAWRETVQQLPEWPFDPPTVARVALYLVLPLGSWLGGALAEHAVSRLLD